MAAGRIGDHVLSTCPRWLIFVEGVGNSPGAQLTAAQREEGDEFFWGENLMGVKQSPVTLKNPSKLIYSPHVFGPGVAGLEYFEDHHFPNNLEAIWSRHFGYIAKATGQPVIVGKGS